MDTKLSTFKNWLRASSTWWVLGTLLAVSVWLTIVVVQKYITDKPVEMAPTIPQPQVTVDIETVKRVEQLEKQLENQNVLLEQQTKTLKSYETTLDSLATTNKQLERRLQSHTEVMKRICEYVVIITVDKKIIPRQCLNDYSWRREEGL
jgi:hypothetical protein